MIAAAAVLGRTSKCRRCWLVLAAALACALLLLLLLLLLRHTFPQLVPPGPAVTASRAGVWPLPAHLQQTHQQLALWPAAFRILVRVQQASPAPAPPRPAPHLAVAVAVINHSSSGKLTQNFEEVQRL